VALLAVSLAGWAWWSLRYRGPIHQHWEAVERGRFYLERGRPDMALQAVSEVRDEAPGAGEAMAVAGLSLVRLGEYRGARMALERALRLQPNQIDAAMGLAQLNLALGNGQRGVEVLQDAARLRPGEFRVWLTLARALHDRGDLEGAAAAYEKALALEVDHREALIGLLGTLMAGSRPERAELWTGRALARYPDDPAILGLAARAAANAGRGDEAARLADQALQREPRNLHALLARAAVRVDRQEWDRALADAELAASVAPNDVNPLRLLLRIETKLGLTERLAATLQARKKVQDRLRLMNQVAEELSRRPDDPELPWKMGRAAEQSGMFLMAGRCFEAALALDPTFRPARESLAALRAAHPELTQAPGRAVLKVPDPARSRPASQIQSEVSR
jgi:tetratricopeptide (TPR) repeat protein